VNAQITRRGLLAGALALPSLVACGPQADTVSGRTGRTSAKPASSPRPAASTPPTSPSPTSSKRAGALEAEEGTFRSQFWPGRRVRWRLVRPARGDSDAVRQPLVVALHSHGGDADWPFSRAHLDRYVLRTGLAVASVDGGDFYWHARRSGIDTGRMVLQDLLPLLHRRGLATRRIGLIGWSMGGYGALLLAGRLGRNRVAGVVAVSAALWESPYNADRGAFDNPADFARNDVLSAPDELRGIPVRLDCGWRDRFLNANQALARELPEAAVTFDEGGHSRDYWVAHAGAQMRWLRRRLQ